MADNTLEKAIKRLPTAKTSPADPLSEDSTADRILIYGTDRGIRIDVRYAGDTLWMTQKQMSDLFGRDISVISRHVANVIAEGELSENGNLQKMQIAGSARPVTLYSLDMIISVGYRVNSAQATQFRIWATERLKEILLKGWSIDVERMKNPGERNRFQELKEVIRDIRASEANVYREVRSICAMCQDYDPQSEQWRNFYAGMQNKLLWAVTQMTGPEIIYNRANSKEENMGLTSWTHERLRKSDVTIANNYLASPEIKEKNRLTNMLLDYFEDQVDLGRLILMSEAESKMAEFIKFNNRPLLKHLGSVKREKAVARAEQQYDVFNEQRRALRHKAD